MPVRIGALFEMLERQAALVGLLLFKQLLARDHHVAAFLVQLDDADFDLLANVAVKIANWTDFELRARQKSLDPDVDRETTLNPPQYRTDDRSLFVGRTFDCVPNPMPLRLVIAQQEAAFGLFSLYHHFDRVARFQFGLAVVIQHLLEGNQPLGLEPDVHHHMLIRQLDDGTGDDVIVIGLCGGFGGLLAVERFQRCGKVFHAGHFSFFGWTGATGWDRRRGAARWGSPLAGCVVNSSDESK